MSVKRSGRTQTPLSNVIWQRAVHVLHTSLVLPLLPKTIMTEVDIIVVLRISGRTLVVHVRAATVLHHSLSERPTAEVSVANLQIPPAVTQLAWRHGGAASSFSCLMRSCVIAAVAFVPPKRHHRFSAPRFRDEPLPVAVLGTAAVRQKSGVPTSARRIGLREAQSFKATCGPNPGACSLPMGSWSNAVFILDLTTSTSLMSVLMQCSSLVGCQ